MGKSPYNGTQPYEYIEFLERRNAELEAEVERLRAALQTIADDPIVRPHREERRSISEILAIAKTAIDAALAGDAAE